MTRRSLIIALLAIAIGAVTACYEARLSARERTVAESGQKKIAQLAPRLVHLGKERDEAQQRLALLEEQRIAAEAKARAAAASASAHAEDVSAWLARWKQVKQSFANQPDQWIPELQLLEDSDWLNMTRRITLDSEADLRKARAAIRGIASTRFILLMGDALRAYAAANGNQLPAHVSQVTPYFTRPVDPAMLDRYEMRASGDLRDHQGPSETIVEKAPIDPDFDSRNALVGASGGTSSPWTTTFMRGAMNEAERNYSLAHNGQEPEELDIAQYVRDPATKAIFQAIEDYQKARGAEPPDFSALRPFLKEPLALPKLEQLIHDKQRPTLR